MIALARSSALTDHISRRRFISVRTRCRRPTAATRRSRRRPCTLGSRTVYTTSLGEVRDIEVERDDKREELALVVKDRDGTKHSARALSDGTLRFLALAVLEAQQQPGLLCIEEPENGIHPGRIQALLDLLQAIAMDTRYPVEEGNPLRQVIISTHSPSIVMRVPEDSLVVAEFRDTVTRTAGASTARTSAGCANTWRDPVPSRKSLPVGAFRTYLNPEGYRPLPRPDPERDPDAETRIMDRADIHRMLQSAAARLMPDLRVTLIGEGPTDDALCPSSSGCSKTHRLA